MSLPSEYGSARGQRWQPVPMRSECFSYFTDQGKGELTEGRGHGEGLQGMKMGLGGHRCPGGRGIQLVHRLSLP